MPNEYKNVPHVRATYTEQIIPRFRGNPLIEALNPAFDDASLVNQLFSLPQFSEEQRLWPMEQRIQQVASLSNFMVPLPRHLELARKLQAMLYEGYVGRCPHTAESNRVYQRLYEAQKSGVALVQPDKSALTAQLSATLIGPSGMGKTVTVKRIFGNQPQLIYHPELHIWQIPYLHVEMPHDGASVKGLAHSIIRKIDNLLPGANYYETYAKSRHSVESLMNHVARLLHAHAVGVLVCDEIQNLENAPKNKEALMTLLVSASNELGVPIIFIGTNKAQRLMTLDFRQARRAAGQGVATWDRLSEPQPGDDGEWNSFLPILWKFQWLQKPVPLTDFLSSLMYQHCQGIVDLAIKLFACCQWRAMLDGTETITPALIADVARRELSVVTPMVDALRRNDLKALDAFDDIKPVAFEDLLRDATFANSGRALQEQSSNDQELIGAAMTSVLKTMGLDDEKSEELAATVVAENKPRNVVEGTKAAISRLTPKQRVSSQEKKPPVSLEPADLRNAVGAEGSPGGVVAKLRTIGATCDISAVLGL